MPTYTQPRYLTVNGFYEAAKAFGSPISKQKIYEACENGSMKAYQNGTHWRIKIELNKLCCLLPPGEWQQNRRQARTASFFAGFFISAAQGVRSARFRPVVQLA